MNHRPQKADRRSSVTNLQLTHDEHEDQIAVSEDLAHILSDDGTTQADSYTAAAQSEAIRLIPPRPSTFGSKHSRRPQSFVGSGIVVAVSSRFMLAGSLASLPAF